MKGFHSCSIDRFVLFLWWLHHKNLLDSFLLPLVDSSAAASGFFSGGELWCCCCSNLLDDWRLSSALSLLFGFSDVEQKKNPRWILPTEKKNWCYVKEVKCFSLVFWFPKKFSAGLTLAAALLLGGSTWKHIQKYIIHFYLWAKGTKSSWWNRTSGLTTSFCSSLTSVTLSWCLGAALFENIPMMPFCDLVDGLDGWLASPFTEGTFTTGSGVGAGWRSLACWSSTDDRGTALVQRIALYLQKKRKVHFCVRRTR